MAKFNFLEKIILKILNFFFDGVNSEKIFPAKKENNNINEFLTHVENRENYKIETIKSDFILLKNKVKNINLKIYDKYQIHKIHTLLNLINTELNKIEMKVNKKSNDINYDLIKNFNDYYLKNFIELYESILNFDDYVFKEEDFNMLNSFLENIEELLKTLNFDKNLQIETNKKLLKRYLNIKYF